MYSDTITLFCHCKASTGDIWYPYILHNVDVNMDRGYILKVYGADASDNVSVHIRYMNDDENKCIIEGYKYLAPKEWAAVPNDQKGEYITLQGGTLFDFFLVGDYGNEDPIMDNDFRMGFYQYMNSLYDNVYVISNVSGPFNLIPHFELLGK